MTMCIESNNNAGHGMAERIRGLDWGRWWGGVGSGLSKGLTLTSFISQTRQLMTRVVICSSS